MTYSFTETYPEERRLATVLFADIRGFTALAEKLDFEKVSDLLKEVWLGLDEVIINHGGYIDKHVGDAVMSVWGVPFGGENDAELAIDAALEMQDWLDQYRKKSQKAGAKRLKLRIGINTGQVLATYVGIRNEYTVIGDAVNIANRLQELVEPGSTLIGEATYQLVRDLFEVEPLGSLELRGKTIPVHAFVVGRKLVRRQQDREWDMAGLETQMVGREYELEKLKTLYNRVITTSDPCLGLVVGEAGLGKSRLLETFTNQLKAENPYLWLISARGWAQTEKSPYFLWRSLWKSHFGLEEANGEAAQVLRNITDQAWPVIDFTNELSDSSKFHAQRIFELICDFFTKLSKIGPIALLVDDLQWVDKASLDVITKLLGKKGDRLSLLMLGGARPEFLRKDVKWVNLAEVFHLKPLSLSADLVRKAFPALEVFDNSVLSELVVRSDGNPYFLEEMVKDLMVSGKSGDLPLFTVIANLPDRLPRTLWAVLQSRLDDLPREFREVVLIASVVGRTFWSGAIEFSARQAVGTELYMLPEQVLARVIQNSLRQLVRSGIIIARSISIFADEQEFAFKQSLMREVAYGMLPYKYRKFYHYAIAKWIEERIEPDFLVTIAAHYEKSGFFASARRYYEEAAKYANSRGAMGEVQWLMARSKELPAK